MAWMIHGGAFRAPGLDEHHMGLIKHIKCEPPRKESIKGEAFVGSVLHFWIPDGLKGDVWSCDICHAVHIIKRSGNGTLYWSQVKTWWDMLKVWRRVKLRLHHATLGALMDYTISLEEQARTRGLIT